MTNEEAQIIIGNMPIKPEVLDDCYDITEYQEAKTMAIKALEQTNVLDKVRAEIMDFEEELFHRPNTDYTDYAAVRHCVEIIDKYKVESEDKE